MDTVAFSIACLGLLLGSVFSALHMCLLDLSRTALEELATQRRARPATLRRIRAIVDDLAGHARAVALFRILFTLALVVAAVRVAETVHGGGGGLRPLSAAIAVLVSALLVWVCNVAFAEAVSTHIAERFVYTFSPVVRAAHILQRPLSPIASSIDAIVRAVSGTKPINRHEELEQELMEVVEEGERAGQIDEVERGMIEAVVNFKSRTVEQIMTPRNEIEALQLTNNLGAITAFVRKARHSRIPVYKENLDDIVGFFYVKDLLRWLAGEGPRAGGGGFDLRTILRAAMMVPETKTIRALAEEFVEQKVHVAVVKDEFGGTAGIVSLEDIVEEVFGDIQDEYEKPEDDPPHIEVRPEDSLAEIDARAYMADVNKALEPLGVELPESDEYDTLGGFVLINMGRIPAQNESFSYGENGRLIITVLEATPTRVLKVRLLLKKEQPTDTSESASSAHTAPGSSPQAPESTTSAGVQTRIGEEDRVPL